MIEWLKLTDERKRQILDQANAATGLPVHAIEKDWWVTLALQALFSTKWKDNLVFKGGTSLSKAWGLIQRFSEDIDLAMDRKVLNFPDEFVSNAQISKLRKKASAFIATEFRDELEKVILASGVPGDQFQLTVQETDVEDRDPQVLVLGYHSALAPNSYIAERVLIEIGARSLREPSSDRPIQTILYEVFPDQPYAGKPFAVKTVDPMRTFLEKAFLLHEEFSKPPAKIRHDRLSRHLYDLERLMDTEHAAAALGDYEFYSSVIDHRQKFNAIRGLSYAAHAPAHINFIPPTAILAQWENDYAAMRESMIYGEAHTFAALIDRLNELLTRFRSIAVPVAVTTVVLKLSIEDTLLAELIEEAENELKGKPYPDGTKVSIRLERRINLYQAASEQNKTRTYVLHFESDDGELVFVSAEEDQDTTS